MKPSLRKAISMFTFYEQVQIVVGILCIKMKQKISLRVSELLSDCNTYVQLIEQNVIFYKGRNKLIKASLLLNKRQVSVFLRKNSSDIKVFRSVIMNEEYKVAAQKLLTDNKPEQVIVDAGGNIGLTTIYLHSFFPNARYFIIEPDEKNFIILKMNLDKNNITSATLFKNALWTSNEALQINNSFRDGKEWSLTVEKINGEMDSDNSFIKGIILEEICSAGKIKEIDLLKIDIEGGERFLFKDAAFLKILDTTVRNLIIEIHDEFNIRNTINSEMKTMGFGEMNTGSVTLFSKETYPIQT
jgi:FkbM family methyltransferase